MATSLVAMGGCAVVPDTSPVSLVRSSSDEPLVLEQAPSPLKRIKAKSARAGPSNPKARKVRNGPISSPLRISRAPVEPIGTERVGLDDEEDEPVFVGSSLATRLADRYIYKVLSDSSSSSPSSPLLRTTPLPPVPPPLPLVAPVSPPKNPIPILPWLGRTAVLLQLPDCVVCRKRWKKSESGAGRWVSNHF